MNRNEIEACYHSVLQDVSSGKLAFAIGNLKRLIRQSTRTDYFYELESIEENYRSLLKYTYEGYQDPKRGEILRSISAAALHLADELTLFLTEDAYPFRK